MLNYKKYIRSQKVRFFILRCLSWIPDSVMLRIQFRIKMGYWPNLNHPKTYSEKLQVYKLRYRNPIMCRCVDKYEVRQYVKDKGLGYILNDLYGVFNSAEEIDFKKLPCQFVAKTTDGSGGQDVIIVDDKTAINEKEVKSFLSSRLGKKDINPGREWAYTGIKKPRIVIEKLLGGGTGLEDFKFLCFNGKFKILWIDKDRYTNHRRGFWNENLEYMPKVSSDHENLEEPFELPGNIDEMIRISEKLSENFPHVRVDLYNICGKIIFGEMTFYPWSGYVIYKPESFDYQLGEFFTEYD